VPRSIPIQGPVGSGEDPPQSVIAGVLSMVPNLVGRDGASDGLVVVGGADTGCAVLLAGSSRPCRSRKFFDEFIPLRCGIGDGVVVCVGGGCVRTPLPNTI